MSSFDLGFIVGLFEGEGTVSIGDAATGFKCRRVSVAMTDKDTIVRLREAVGYGKVSGPFATPEGCKPVYEWKCSGWYEQRSFCFLVYPYMSERRKKQIAKFVMQPAGRRGRKRRA